MAPTSECFLDMHPHLADAAAELAGEHQLDAGEYQVSVGWDGYDSEFIVLTLTTPGGAS